MNNKTYHNPTLRVIDILEALDRTESGMTLTELSENIGAAKSTISPILITLLNRGYINWEQHSQKYVIGIRAFLLGHGFSKKSHAVDYIQKEMQDIVDTCNEVCQLGVLIDYEVFYLAKVDAKQPINLISFVGQKLPAYTTALGKALLSGCSDTVIRQFYGANMPKVQERTITDVEILLTQIHKIRAGNLAYEVEEVNVGTACIAVPIEKENQVVAAISVSYPLFRATEDKISLIEKKLWEKKYVVEKMVQQLDLNF